MVENNISILVCSTFHALITCIKCTNQQIVICRPQIIPKTKGRVPWLNVIVNIVSVYSDSKKLLNC